MTVKEAYKIAVGNDRTKKIAQCLETESWFAFFLVPVTTKMDPEHPSIVGSIMTGVDKKTGKRFPINVFERANEIANAKEVNVETYLDMEI